MALSDLTFKFYTDTGLTVAFSGLYQLVHQTDLSDNPQDFKLYFGSAQTVGTRTLKAVSNPGVDQIVLTPTDTSAEWVVAHSYTLGTIIEPVTPNGYKYKVTTAGTSHASTQPTWPTTIGSTVADNTVVWTCVGPVHAIAEMKLALTAGGLTGATPGAALNLGTTITSGAANKVEVNIRIANSNTNVNDNTGFPELGININNVQEETV